MKIRGSIIWFVTIVIVLIVLVVWIGRRPAKTSVPIAVSSKPMETIAAIPALSATNAPAPITGHVAGSNPSSAVSVPRKSKEQETLEILSTQNDIQIIFYGRLEDQFGNPVTGAQIVASVRIYNGVQSTVERFSVTSDANGLFQINHGKGESLGLMPQKLGYALATTGTEFRYSHLEEHPYVPDAGNPTVIKMWKLQGAEPLVGISKTYKLPYSGAPIFLDLVAGKEVPSGGDLEVIIIRAPGSITQRKQDHRDWSIKLVPVNGGIMESDALAFEAPVDGYQDSYLVQMKHDDPAWFDNIQKAFFLKSRNGQIYSKFSMDFGINDDPNGTMWFQFNGVANTNSSRNWEATAPQ